MTAVGDRFFERHGSCRAMSGGHRRQGCERQRRKTHHTSLEGAAKCTSLAGGAAASVSAAFAGRKLRLLARAFVWRDLQIGAVQLLAPALDDEIESNFILKHMGARRVIRAGGLNSKPSSRRTPARMPRGRNRRGEWALKSRGMLSRLAQARERRSYRNEQSLKQSFAV
jgi:hypothetical protein